jgi:hypothetical protein
MRISFCWLSMAGLYALLKTHHSCISVLMMVYNTQNYWVFGLCPSSGILNLENTAFRKLDLFPSSGTGGLTLLGPLDLTSITGQPMSETQ